MSYALTYLEKGAGRPTATPRLDSMTPPFRLSGITLRWAVWGRHRDDLWLCKPFDELKHGDMRFGVVGPCVLAWVNASSAKLIEDRPEGPAHPAHDWSQPEAQALWARGLVDWLALARAPQLLMAADAAIYRSEHDWFFPEGPGGELVSRGPQDAIEDNAKALMLAAELAQLWQGWAARGWTGEELIWGFLDALSELGEWSKANADSIRQELRNNPKHNPWEALWFKEPIERLQEPLGVYCHALQISAQALWADRVKARWERSKRHRPALSRGVLTPVMDIKSAQFDERGQAVTEGRLIATQSPTIPASLARALANDNALERLWGSVYAHRLINHLAIATHEASEQKVQDPRTVIFEGGWTGLREALGYTRGKNDELRHLIEAGQHLSFQDHKGNFGGLWTWADIKAARGRKAQLKLIVNDPLLPNFNERYSGSALSEREAKRLIPILEDEPPLSALRNNEQGAALALCWLALIELRDNADELCRDGAISTSAQRWEALAKLAGLPPVSLSGLLESWAQGDDTAPALIERQGDQWTLAEPHYRARDFIREAGQMMLNGSENGRKRKDLKQAKHGSKRK